MIQKRLGVWLKWTHREPQTLDYIRSAYNAGHMRCIRVYQPDFTEIAEIYTHCPDAVFFPRQWEWSDGDIKRGDMLRDPEGTGQRIADLWWGRINEWFARANREGTPFPDLEQLVPVGINEPNETRRPVEISLCDLAFLRRLRSYSSLLKGCSLNFSTGNPGELHNGISDYRPYQDNLDECERFNHYLTLHEYWRAQGPARQDDAGWLAWRHRHVVKFGYRGRILIGECGHDRIIYNESAGHGGWMDYQGSLGVDFEKAGDIYVGHLAEYTRNCHPQVVGVLPFTTDYESNEWHTFDTRPIHGKILSRLSEFNSVQQPPSPPDMGDGGSGEGDYNLRLPILHGGKTEKMNKTVETIDRVNLRHKPDLNAAIYKTTDWGEKLTVTGGSGQWVRVRYDNLDLWAHADYVRDVDTLPDPSAISDFDRAMPFVFEIEGGYVNDPVDPGGETKYGISKNSYPSVDIKNLTKQQAKEIYRKDYWPHAQHLTWPMNLLHFDACINHGPAQAARFLAASNGDPYEYLAERIRFFTSIKNWPRYGVGWMRRVARLMEEINA